MMKEITGIKETCLYIHDLDQAKNFYHTRLGLDIIHYEPGKHIFFRAGSSVLLCFNPEDSRKKHSPPAHYADGDQHLAFEVPADLYSETLAWFRKKEIEIIDQLKWKSGQESFYFKDPEGNILEIVPKGVWD